MNTNTESFVESPDEVWTFCGSHAPSLEGTTIDDDDDDDAISPNDREPPECWWESMEELAQASEYNGILEESALQADLAEQNAREMEQALRQSNVSIPFQTKQFTAETSLSTMSSLTHTSDEDSLQEHNCDDFDGEEPREKHTVTLCTSRSTIDNDASITEAIEESIFQASFAEQTANEMIQVLTWWDGASSHENCQTPTQQDCLPKNSLVVSTPEAKSFFSAVSLSLQSTLIPTCLYANSTHDVLLHNKVTLSSMETAKSQAFQVSMTLQKADEMRNLLNDLIKSNVSADDVDVVASQNWDTACVRGKDVILNWHSRMRILYRWVQHFVANWLWNQISPDIQLVWIWLVQRPRVAAWLGRGFIIIILFICCQLLSCSTTNNARAMKYVHFKEFLSQPPYITSPVHSARHSWKYQDCNNIFMGESSMDLIIL